MQRIFLIALLAILLLLGCDNKTDQEIKAEFSGSREVKVAVARRGDISSYIEFSGKLDADETVNISPAFSAKIKKIAVVEGRLVNQGDLLAELEDRQLVQAKTQFDNLEKSYFRMVELKKSGAIDKASYDEVETAYKIAKSNLDFVMENTHIRAPMDGVITMIYKKAGENYDAMMDPFLIRMINLKRFKAKIQVSDADINQVKKLQNVIVKVNSSTEDFIGKVAFISPEADLMSGTFEVEIEVKNRGNQLRNNQFARIKLLTETADNTIIIPQKAVIKNNLVFTVENGKAVKNPVELGIGNEYEIEVRSGLQENDQVVILGNVGLTAGDPVEIIK